MEITRTHDAELVNRILSEAFGTPIDHTKVIEDEANYVLVGAHGAMLFAFTKPGLYSVTSAVTQMGHGQWAVEFGRATTAWMFEHTEAERLWASVTEANKRAIVTMKAAIDCDVERSGPLSIASITRERWSNRHDQMA